MKQNKEQIGMYLYDVPKGSKIRVLVDARTAPFSEAVKADDILIFEKIDGIYSICKNAKNRNVYLGVKTYVEIIK